MFQFQTYLEIATVEGTVGIHNDKTEAPTKDVGVDELQEWQVSIMIRREARGYSTYINVHPLLLRKLLQLGHQPVLGATAQS